MEITTSKKLQTRDSVKSIVCKASGLYESSIVMYLDLSNSMMSSKSLTILKTLDWNCLKELNVSHNKIQRVDGDFLLKMPLLQRLNLSFNALESIPTFISKKRELSLSSLALEGNRISNVKDIKKLYPLSKCLKRISFQGHGDESACTICTNLNYYRLVKETLPNLIILDYDLFPTHASLLQQCRKDLDSIDEKITEISKWKKSMDESEGQEVSSLEF